MNSDHVLAGDRRRQKRERTVHAAFRAATLLSIAISVAIVVSLIGEAVAFLAQVELDQLLANGWFPRRSRFNVSTLVVHTLLVSSVAMMVATPIGLGAAMYLSEYAPPRVRRVLKPALEVLAGIPSVVIGFFALRYITPQVIQPLFPATDLSNFAAAGLGVGILIVPLIASVSEDAMRAVPQTIRAAAYGLGAKKWHTSVRVVFPAALSGIIAGLILGVSRAIGETMVVAIAAGATGGSLTTFNPLDGGQTMTGAMASLAIGSDQVAGVVAAFQSLFFVGLLLFVMTLALNMVSERVVRRFRQRY